MLSVLLARFSSTFSTLIQSFVMSCLSSSADGPFRPSSKTSSPFLRTWNSILTPVTSLRSLLIHRTARSTVSAICERRSLPSPSELMEEDNDDDDDDDDDDE